MQIIYDKEKAIVTKQKIDSDTPEVNRQAEKHNHIRLFACVIVYFIFFFVLLHISDLYCKYFDAIKIVQIVGIFTCGMLMLIGAIIAGNVYNNICEPICTAAQRYPLPVRYHLATQENTVVRCEFTEAKNKIELTLEDASHRTKQEKLFLLAFHSETRTDIKEIIINLDEKTIYKPVKSEHWDTLSIVSADGNRIEIPTHHIEVDL